MTGTHEIRCSEIWGGNGSVEATVSTSILTAAISSKASDGEAGGDIYFFSVCSQDDITRIAIADLRGHGDQVSKLSGWLYQALEERMNTLDGAGVLTQLNRLTLAHGFDAITTAVVASYCLNDSKLYFSYAGHPPIIARLNGKRWSSLSIQGAPGVANLPLGVLPDVRYDQFEVRLQPQDRLFLYTDGLSERPNGKGDLYGEERLRDILDRTGDLALGKIKEEVLADLAHFSQGGIAIDDCTLMVVEVSPESNQGGPGALTKRTKSSGVHLAVPSASAVLSRHKVRSRWPAARSLDAIASAGRATLSQLELGGVRRLAATEIKTA